MQNFAAVICLLVFLVLILKAKNVLYPTHILETMLSTLYTYFFLFNDIQPQILKSQHLITSENVLLH